MMTRELQLSWIIRRHLDDVIKIEHEIFDFPWDEADFLVCLRQRDYIGTVIEDVETHEILGYVIYQLSKGSLRIVNFAVSKSHQRVGVGSFAIKRIIEKLTQQRRNQIILEVRETNLAAQLFFSSLEFKAVKILPHHYDENSESAYLMKYTLGDSE